MNLAALRNTIMAALLLMAAPALAQTQATIVQGTTAAMTGTTSTQVVAAPGAGFRNMITTVVCSNSHATVGTDVAIQDGQDGPTLMTIGAAALFGTNPVTLPYPLRQPTPNTGLYAANVTTGASVKCTAVGYKGT